MTFLTAALLAASLAQAKPEGWLYEKADGNGADKYRKLSVTVASDDLALVAQFQQDQAVDRDRLKAAFARIEPALNEIRAAALCRETKWTYATSDPTQDLPHAKPGLKAARLLTIRGTFRLQAGEVDGAIEDFLLALKIGSDFSMDRMLAGKLTGCLIVSVAMDAFQRHLGRRSLDEAQLNRIHDHAAFLLDRMPAPARLIDDERDCALASVDHVVDKGLAQSMKDFSGEDSGQTLSELLRRIDEFMTANREACRAEIKARVSSHFGLLAKDVQERLFSGTRHLDAAKIQKDATARFEKILLNKSASKEEWTQGSADVIALILLPRMDNAKKQHWFARMALQNLKTWSTLELYRLKRGKYPATLDDADAKTEDPVDGKAMKYATFQVNDRPAFVVSSAGPKGDAAARATALAEMCGFDVDAFSRISRDCSETLGYTIFGYHADGK